MANIIKCPNCGENNPAEVEFCQYCQARLQPLTGPLKGADRPITPGDNPTKKTTSELEPMLPQWLRDAREGARQDEAEQPLASSQRPSSPSASEPDLLAGLRFQGGDDSEDDTPDWLANITGAAPKSKKQDAEPAGVRWVEIGGKDDFAQEPTSSAANDTPDWLSNIQNSTPAVSPEKDDVADWFQQAATGGSEPKSQPIGNDNDWLNQLADSQNMFSESDSTGQDTSNTFDDAPDWLKSSPKDESQSKPPAWLHTGELKEPASKEETPNWLKPASQEAPSFGDTPDWLKQMSSEHETPSAAPQQKEEPQSFGDTPDWLKQMGGEQTSQPAFESAPANDDADWLKSLGGDEPIPPQQQETPQSFGDTPDWLKQMGSEQTSQPAIESAPANDDADWLKSLGGEQATAPQESSSDETPDWLKQMGANESQSGDNAAFVGSSFAETEAGSESPDWLSGLPAQESAPAEESSENAPLGDLPNWLKSAAPQSSIFDEPAPENIPASTSEWDRTFSSESSAPAEQTPAFASSDLSGADLFTEMPDWLSSTNEEQPSSFAADTPAAETAISQSELPSWVQAMRPIDTGAPAASSSGDQTLEQRGALAGLQGVLPAVPGYAPSSKPKAYSIKLQASDEQQSHAALLEQILAAEGDVTPVASFTPLASSRPLRWTIAFVFFAAIFAVTFLHTTIFSMPFGVPFELSSAIQVVQSLPAGAPILVAVDYEPARAGELEAAAAPMFDQLMLLKQSRFTFVSTSDKGGVLVERFMSGPLAVHNYQSGNQYLNLGYLPGGVIGVRAFAQNPQQTMPFDVNQFRAWDLAPVTGVSSFSNYAALIIVADDIDSVRAWVEQTQSLRGTMPVVVVTSAQAAPMIQPYYASGQIQGMVGGLYGGALFEQNNAGRPGTARSYWDGYSIGSLLAAAFIVLGGLWNLILGLRERSAKQDLE